jgi:DNA-binding FrmR family transcriptional regulator
MTNTQPPEVTMEERRVGADEGRPPGHVGDLRPEGSPSARCGGSERRMMSDEVRADVLLRLRKLNGQVQGVARMVEADRYCVDVLQQLSAVQSAVEAVSKVVTRNYLERCVTEAVNGGDPLIYDEVMRVIFRRR